MNMDVLARTSLVASLLALAPSVASADVLVVDASGAGAYTQIQAAVTAARHGDTILVKSGAYDPFAVVGKTLSIVADTHANVQVMGAIHIRDVRSGHTAVIAGINATGHTTFDGYNAYGLVVLDCSGTVRVQDGQFRGVSYSNVEWYGSGSGASIESSADVALLACDITGGNGLCDSVHTWGAASGLGVGGSRTALYDSHVHGGQGVLGCTSTLGEGVYAGDGARCVSGFVFASGCTFAGGTGGAGDSGAATNGGEGGDGLVLPAPFGIAELLDCAYQGGSGGAPGCVGGTCGRPGSSGRPIVGMSQAGFLSGQHRIMSAPSVLREQVAGAFRFHGVPGDQVWLIVSDTPGFDYSPALSGVQLTRTTRATRVLSLGHVSPTSGDLSRALAFPDPNPDVLAKTYFLQSLFEDAAGSWILGSASCLVVLDPAY
jgi:hypothetical protein